MMTTKILQILTYEYKNVAIINKDTLHKRNTENTGVEIAIIMFSWVAS